MPVRPDDGLPSNAEPSLLDDAPFLDGVSGMRRTAHFSPCGTWRYRLVRQWAETGTFAVFLMLNPSAADERQDDPTVRRCIGFARAWGHAGLVVLNAYALRSTDPKALGTHPSPEGEREINDRVIAAAAGAAAADGVPVVVAWGVHAAPARVARILDLLHAAGADVRALGVTKDGAPRHPLYVSGSALLLPWPPAPNSPADADARAS